jgi:hypothetical protein
VAGVVGHLLRLPIEKNTAASGATVQIAGVGAVGPSPWAQRGARGAPKTAKPHIPTKLL